jgi:hypothetical protein
VKRLQRCPVIDVRIERGPESLALSVPQLRFAPAPYPYQKLPRGQVRLVIEMPARFVTIRALAIFSLVLCALYSVPFVLTDTDLPFVIAAWAVCASTVWIMAYSFGWLARREVLTFDSVLVSDQLGERASRVRARREVTGARLAPEPNTRLGRWFRRHVMPLPQIQLCNADGRAIFSAAPGISRAAAEELLPTIEQFLLDHPA